jgi:hypothetical protein
MEIGIYEPPPRSPSPPPQPPRKYRSAIITVALFVGGFCVTLAVLSRHELTAIISHHAAKPAVTEVRTSVPMPTPQTANATNVQPPLAQTQAAVMPPSVFQ